MAVEIRVANVKLTHVNAIGGAIDKDAVDTTIELLRLSASQEHRIIPNGSGDAESPNNSDSPRLATYLAREADDGFALAYLDQYIVITQMIT